LIEKMMSEIPTVPTPVHPILPPENRAAGLRSFLVEMLQTLLFSILLFTVIQFATARVRVQSISMQPTLYEKDFVLVNRLVYRLGGLQRQDIIVFQPPFDAHGEPYIKRLIGLPGDTVRITAGRVYVNDEPLQENYLAAPPDYGGQWVVPEDALFVLGDNRNQSSDSHHWGMVPLENVMGKAEFVYWPVGHWQALHPARAAAAAP
jgi:signal peptidase I